MKLWIEKRMKLWVCLFPFFLLSCCEAFRTPSTKMARNSGKRFSLCAAEEINNLSKRRLPKAIIFDLDGCLWTPEMYEIVYFMGGKGSPFRTDPDSDNGSLLTVGDQPVKLLGDVRSVFWQLHSDPLFETVQIGISSRTDEPDWARELLKKFQIQEQCSLEDVLDGPIEIAKDAKVEHFSRIRTCTGIAYEDMVFFDNEYGNCQQVASLGVTVVYCPDGVTRDLFESMLTEEFPRSDGSVINSETRGYW